jgi:hypothetical protein
MADPSETTQVSHEPTGHDAELVEAVRSLAAQVGSLKDDVHALRSDAGALPRDQSHGWNEGAAVVRDGPAWVRSVDSPKPRGIAIPWLLAEILFLVAVAVLCAVAGLDAPVIVGVMVAAWVLVALAEWLVWRAERERHSFSYPRGTQFPMRLPDDRTWFDSNGDDTLFDLDLPSAERPPTRLPPPE